MAKNGYKILDSDMHVFEPHDLYLKYMNPKWSDRIPRGQPRTTHGQIKFTFADGKPIRASGTQVLAANLTETEFSGKFAGRNGGRASLREAAGASLRCSVAIGGDGRRGLGRGSFISDLSASLR